MDGWSDFVGDDEEEGEKSEDEDQNESTNSLANVITRMPSWIQQASTTTREKMRLDIVVTTTNPVTYP